jgi:hypothetical protein
VIVREVTHEKGATGPLLALNMEREYNSVNAGNF